MDYQYLFTGISTVQIESVQNNCSGTVRTHGAEPPDELLQHAAAFRMTTNDGAMTLRFVRVTIKPIGEPFVDRRAKRWDTGTPVSDILEWAVQDRPSFDLRKLDLFRSTDEPC